MFLNGDSLIEDSDFYAHSKNDVPIQVYHNDEHRDIGFVDEYSPHFIQINNNYYNRTMFTFISRPGY